MLIHHWIYSWKIMILQILESFKSKCSKSNLFKYLKMSSMKFICPKATLTNPIFTFILDQILIHQLITEIGLLNCPTLSEFESDPDCRPRSGRLKSESLVSSVISEKSFSWKFLRRTFNHPSLQAYYRSRVI